MYRSVIRVAGLSGLLVLVSVGTALGVTPLQTRVSRVAFSSTCSASQLSVKLDPDFSDAAMGGQRGDSFIVINISKRSCSMNGQPGVMLLDRKGRTMGPVFKAMVGDTIELKPGGKATFEIGYHSCTYAANMSGKKTNKCPISSKVQIRFADIKGVFTLRERIDADGGIEQVFDLEAKHR